MSNASLELGGDNWAAKDGNLLGYAVGDSSGKYVPREFTFTRGSNLAATRVAANGLIEKGRENLFLQSNQFDTSWPKNKLNLTSGQSGYDGSSDAWKITSNDTGSSYVRQIITSSGVQTASVYAAKGNVDYIYFRIAGSQNQGAFINLSNGTIDSYLNQGNIIDISVNNVSGDWYRISITFNTTTSDIRFYASDSGGSNSETGSYIYIQDAQLEQGLVATNYIETGATTVQAGLLEDEPRIDYTGGTGSLLLEPSRTNLVEYSEYFEGSGWNIQPNTTTAELTQETLSPEGLYNAYKFAGDGSSGFYKASAGIYGGENTKSIYLKAAVNGTQVVLKDPNQTVTTKTLTLTTDWVRYELTETQTSSFGIWIDDIPSDPIYAWGAQVEEGSYATSYIPNHSGGSVTRNTDVTLSLTNAGADGLINNYNTTIFINLKKIISVNNVIRFVTLFPNGGANNPRVLLYGNMSNALVQYRVTGQADQSITSPYNRDEVNKIAIRISGTSLTMFHNGEEVNTITIVQGDDLEYLSLAESAATDSGYLLNQLLSFPTALSDAECITLTTL